MRPEFETREARAARNEALFRAVNEQVRQVNDAFAAITDEFTIVCECADMRCSEPLTIGPSDYSTLRANDRQFAVLPGHVDPEIERIVRETDGYVVVEKVGDAAAVAEQLAAHE